MKTKELIEKTNELRLIGAKQIKEYILFYEKNYGFEFYAYPLWGTTRGDGTATLKNAGDIYMVDLFELLDFIDEYRHTPESEREDPKLYNVKFPAITRDGKPIYLARHTGENDRIGVDWSSKGYIEKIKSQFAFTEQEIKDINASYWEFAEEVTK